MIHNVRTYVDYTDGRAPRVFERELLGYLTFETLSHIFGDDFWELLIASVLPYPDASQIDNLRYLREEFNRYIEKS